MWFSLKLRWYAWREAGSTPDVRIFVMYYAPRAGRALEHSLGLPEGRIGVVRAFASPASTGANQVVIAHELLHTVGAQDKYDQHGHPIAPHGYADPGRQPPWPQERAELMAGRIPLGPAESRMPASLAECVVGEATAKEISWLRGE
jgi:hypothetical protein